MSKAAIRQLLAERGRGSRDEDEDEDSFWDRHKGKIIGGIALAGAAGFAAHKFGKGKTPPPSTPDEHQAAVDQATADASAARTPTDKLNTSYNLAKTQLLKFKEQQAVIQAQLDAHGRRQQLQPGGAWTDNPFTQSTDIAKLNWQKWMVGKRVAKAEEVLARFNQRTPTAAPSPPASPSSDSGSGLGSDGHSGGNTPWQESTNIKHFIKMLGESDYSGADSYLKQIVNDKLQAKISKQYQLQKLY